MVEKFEVGKKYVHMNTKDVKKTDIIECLFIGEKCTFMREIDVNGSITEFAISNINANYFNEYKEPRKFVRYFNVYDDGNIGIPFNSREDADKRFNSHQRLACVRAEFVEGQFDE